MIITTCAFREPYLTHNINQLNAITGCPVLAFRDCLPYSEGIIRTNVVTRFQESLYGFKPHAVQAALDMGHRYIVWFDPSVLPLEPIDTIFDQLRDSEMLVITGEVPVKDMANDAAIQHFGGDYGVNHVGGTIYAFNFNMERTRQAFKYWIEAEQAGIFGDQDAFMAGHWADEACMALAMAKAGVEQKQLVFNYKNQKDG